MWGFGGRYYWGRKVACEKAEGIVVVFAWMSSEEKHLMRYVDLYSSFGWNSLVCHSQFLNILAVLAINGIKDYRPTTARGYMLLPTIAKGYMDRDEDFNIDIICRFFPEKSTILAVDLLNELVEVLKIRPCPIVFASFSGGAKACMLKILQIITGKCETYNMDDYQLVRDCISGYIYDSSPVDFTSDMGVRFLLHPTVLKVSHPPRFASWIVNRIASENDDLAPFEVISNFFHRLKDLGGDVKLIKWSASPHVGHFRHHPADYKAAITEILGKAVAIYCNKNKRIEDEKLGIEGTEDEITDPFSELRKAAMTSTSFQGFALAPSENLSPSSMEYYDGKDVGSITDERKRSFIRLPSRPSINAHGVLGQVLFDVCVPRNVEDWDIRSNSKNARVLGGGFSDKLEG
ncbi:hypothetical protein SESBI_31841 [Sesbania bispinosa]|nr:hypothetical protein SESBI_31841 [Sesbania bispinosa]